MKAMVFTKYGNPDVLHLKEVEKPTPEEDEILIKIHATTVTFGDVVLRRKITRKNFNMPILFYPIVKILYGVRKPKKNIEILGAEFTGKVEAVGDEVTLFSPGDEVFGYRSDSVGCNTEYISVDEYSCVAEKPAIMSYEEVVHIPYGAMTAYSILDRMNIQSGQKVLINGASGGIGSYAVQIAKNSYGAEVTGVCSTTKVDFVKNLGADKVIDYTKEDFTKNGEKYDLIFDILNKTKFSRVKKSSLIENGRLVLVSFGLRQVFAMYFTKLSFWNSKRLICALSGEGKGTLLKVKKLIETGKIKSIIDKEFPLEKLSEAHAYVEEGHKKGGVIISITPSKIESPST
ncbi:MAG: NAD(P)-dependent alcohol dehydrogenase [Candidatus Hodarchaeales archaeon]|jgi:NADPH:quinone reductase-like Zn-dependent oxidoreductase